MQTTRQYFMTFLSKPLRSRCSCKYLTIFMGRHFGEWEIADIGFLLGFRMDHGRMGWSRNVIKRSIEGARECYAIRVEIFKFLVDKNRISIQTQLPIEIKWLSCFCHKSMIVQSFLSEKASFKRFRVVERKHSAQNFYFAKFKITRARDANITESSEIFARERNRRRDGCGSVGMEWLTTRFYQCQRWW